MQIKLAGGMWCVNAPDELKLILDVCLRSARATRRGLAGRAGNQRSADRRAAKTLRQRRHLRHVRDGDGCERLPDKTSADAHPSWFRLQGYCLVLLRVQDG